MSYERTQVGYTPIPYAIFSIGMVVFMAQVDEQSPGWVIPLTAVFLFVIFLILLAFNWLRVTVDEQEVTAAFALGKPHRTFALVDVESVQRVRNKWFYGWGVRKTPHGWMYNVWGLDAVELRFADGTAFRIGTDDPDGLEAAVSLGASGARTA